MEKRAENCYDETMYKNIIEAVDSRQFSQWGKYLEGIGWQVAVIEDVQIFSKKIPFIARSIIKIQHPHSPLPFVKIDIFAKQQKALMVIVEPHVRNYDQHLLLKNGFKKVKMHLVHSATVKVDLKQTEEALFASFSENARRNIRKAQKNNLKVKQVFLKDDKEGKHFEQFLKLFRNLAKMKKIYDPGDKDFYAKREAFLDSSFLLFAYLDQETEPIAVVWYGFYKDVVVYLQTGITQKGYQLLANYLLVWEGLKIAQSLGLGVLDFESIYDERYPGEGKRWKGYSEFKKRFHGEVVLYPDVWVKYYSKPIKWLYTFANLFSK